MQNKDLKKKQQTNVIRPMGKSMTLFILALTRSTMTHVDTRDEHNLYYLIRLLQDRGNKFHTFVLFSSPPSSSIIDYGNITYEIFVYFLFDRFFLSEEITPFRRSIT